MNYVLKIRLKCFRWFFLGCLGHYISKPTYKYYNSIFMMRLIHWENGKIFTDEFFSQNNIEIFESNGYVIFFSASN